MHAEMYNDFMDSLTCCYPDAYLPRISYSDNLLEYRFNKTMPIPMFLISHNK